MQELLQQFFSSFGKVVDVQMGQVLTGDTDAACAHVVFTKSATIDIILSAGSSPVRPLDAGVLATFGLSRSYTHLHKHIYIYINAHIVYLCIELSIYLDNFSGL